MTDLFHQSPNIPAPKQFTHIVPWSGLIYSQCEREGLLDQIAAHINSMDKEDACNYAKFLHSMASFPPWFFNACPNVRLDIQS